MAVLQRQAHLSLSRLCFGLPSVATPSRSPLPLLSAIALPSISLQIPGFLSDVWEGILKAVPKKKTSHMKRRHRQLAGKALKDVKSVVNCPGCGRPKKAHFLCPYCVAGMFTILSRKIMLTVALEMKQGVLDKYLNKMPKEKTEGQNQ